MTILDWVVAPAMLIFAGVVIYVVGSKILKRMNKNNEPK